MMKRFTALSGLVSLFFFLTFLTGCQQATVSATGLDLEEPKVPAINHTPLASKDKTADELLTLRKENTTPCTFNELLGNWMMVNYSSNLPEDVLGTLMSRFQVLEFNDKGEMRILAAEEQPYTEAIVFAMEAMKGLPSPYIYKMNNIGDFEIIDAESNNLILPGHCAAVKSDYSSTDALGNHLMLKQGQIIFRTGKKKEINSRMLVRVFSKVNVPDIENVDVREKSENPLEKPIETTTDSQ